MTRTVDPVLRGPAFSTYRPEDVGWLVTDVTDQGLERSMAEREPDIQAGRAHYSESLPVEYTPSTEYEAAYLGALTRESATTAAAVGRLGRVFAEADEAPVVVSLARAGVPVGVLLRRWLKRERGWDVPHYAISIVRDRGIDARALDLVVERHGAEAVRFLDGWTGKGVITRELCSSIRDYNVSRGTAVSSDLAVLSDPLGVSALAATREDLLVPSACLNATVTGLVSRTVRTDALDRAGLFDGASFYRGLADADRTAEFVERIEAHFESPDTLSPWRPSEPREAEGVIDALLDRWGVADDRYLKPGLGEATRVLLRRPPAKLVVDPSREESIAHLRQLARERGVPVVEDPRSPFAAIGIVARVGE